MPDENTPQDHPIPQAATAGEPLPAAGQTPDLESRRTEPGEVVTQGPDDRDLRTRVVDVLKQCYDPEIPVDIYELGLIYNIDIDDGGNTVIKMTLTSPMCPVAESLPPDVERRVGEVEGIRDVRVDVVWEPTWDKEMMSEVAKLKLNMF
jgi:FeS assembly SUF system protein